MGWTPEKRKQAAEKRKATMLARIMEDRQVGYEEAEEIWKNRFSLMGKKGGGKAGFRDKERAARAGRKGAIKRWGDSNE